MKMVRFASLIIVLSLVSACSGTLVGSGEEIGENTTIISEVPTVRFGLVSDVVYKGYSSRRWNIKDNFLKIYADMNGDGRLGFVRIRFDFSAGGDQPKFEKDDDGFLLHWPFGVLATVSIGDVDKDGDADIILETDDKPYFLINEIKKYTHIQSGDSEFNLLLKDINELIVVGDYLTAFELAFDIALGSPHGWHPPGEGPKALYDRHSVADLSEGNCVTWVEQILAMLGSAGTYDGFLDRLISIRYLDGIKEYAMRNHFQSADWIPNNITSGYIVDLLPSLLGDDAPHVEAIIDKKNWYAAKATLEGDFSDLSEEDREKRLFEFQSLGSFMGSETIQLGYYPFIQMVIEEGDEYVLNPNFVKYLPGVSIFNVVNDELVIKNGEGEWITDLVVTHVGFLVKNSSEEIFVYHSTNKTDTALSIMSQEAFLSFLKSRYLDNDNTKAVGLHLSEPRPIGSSAVLSLKELLK